MARYTTRKMRMSCGHVEEWTQIPGTVFPEAWEVCDACSRAGVVAERPADPVETVEHVEDIHPLTHTGEGMVLAALERGIDVEARLAAWSQDELSEEDDW